MKKIILLITILFSGPTLAEKNMCWVKYQFEGDVQPKGTYGGSGQELTSIEPFLYPVCKRMCYESLPKQTKLTGVKSCTLDGIPIEETRYKKLYEESRHKICHVQVIGQYTHNIYLANNEAECKQHMKDYIMCHYKDNKCTYTLGQY